MRRSLYHIKWYFARTDLNTDRGKAENKKRIMKYVKWYTPEKERQYPTSFKVDFVGQPYEGACYYRITRCPVCAYAEKLGVSELMPQFCELDEVMIALQHGVLHRTQTIAGGGDCCDYFITGDKAQADLTLPAHKARAQIAALFADGVRQGAVFRLAFLAPHFRRVYPWVALLHPASAFV